MLQSFGIFQLKEIAVTFAVLFALLNIFGARKSSGIQKIFVIGLLFVLGAFIADGLWNIFSGTNPLVSFNKKDYNTANWSADGKTLSIITKFSFNGNERTSTEVWTLTNAKTLSIESIR